MFEEPAAKRVRREELYSPPSSPRSSPDAELTDLFRSRLQQDYEVAPTQPLAESKSGVVGALSEDEDELEFCLFAPAATTADAPTQKIRVRSPSPAAGDGGFVNGGRPQSYYFAGEMTGSRRREFERIAVSGQDVLDRSKRAWPGCALPWKVRVVAPRSGKLLQDPWKNAVERESKHRRAGKKARIALRKKAQAQNEKLKLRNMSEAEKEAAEREKRTKRNREKKVKKKERDKAKKATETGGSGDGAAEGSPDVGSKE
ncbi:hypothetical protein K490DRAFT_68806 [Saccharata proteae CBS 121410]|uniref:Uncharacterized protein n=1 Tax=Saccharata proteae CBS 121410 TaxID=1314787 RepID=A0A9P4LTZ3_9PEZI|nr:hypothetical protein K490DRAFT_68806 [Saccharata proteae CBS 121410]